MHIPIRSVISLSTEIVITISVYYVIWRAYRTGRFLRVLALVVLTYETLFNISYMASREVGAHAAEVTNPYATVLGAVHGIFSLIMFLTLVVFFLRAMRSYARGENYFLIHRTATRMFVIAWGISIVSGISLFISLYFF